jgi:uncharacterized membrane protein
MDASIAAGLSYLPIAGLLFFFVEKVNRFIRFHAAQAILLYIVAVGFDVVWQIFISVLSAFDALGFLTLGVGCLGTLVGIGLLGLGIWGLISGFTGTYTKLPLIGDIAERWVGGPPVPIS